MLSTDLLLDRRPGTMHVITSRDKVRAELHFCPACVETELTTLGYAYVHRAHQIAGVYVCARHGLGICQLLPDGRDWFAEHGAFTNFPKNSVELVEATGVDPDDLQNYAEFVAAALDGSLLGLSHSTRTALCHRQLTGKNRLHTTSLQIRQVYQSAEARYGRRFLEDVGAAWLAGPARCDEDPAAAGGRHDSAFGIGLALLASSFRGPHHFRKAIYERFDCGLETSSTTEDQPEAVEKEMVAP